MNQNPPNDDNPNLPDRRKEDFLYPRAPYYGEFKPENLLFNANLQEFAQKVSFICNLETGGKISSLEAYQKIKALWKDLKQSKKGLGIGENPFQKDDFFLSIRDSKNWPLCVGEEGRARGTGKGTGRGRG